MHKKKEKKMIINVIPNTVTACSFIYKCKQRENVKKHPYFHFELKRQAGRYNY